MILFTSQVLLDREGPFPTFLEALKDFWPRFIAYVKKKPQASSLGSCWIEANLGGRCTLIICYHEINNFCVRNGLFTENAELKDPLPEISQKHINDLLGRAQIGPRGAPSIQIEKNG